MAQLSNSPNAIKLREWRKRNPGKASEYARRWQWKNPEMFKAYSLAYKRARPEWKAAQDRKFHEKNPFYLKDRARAKKLFVLNAYGNQCVCCGERQPAFLTIDHINGDGAAHRDEIFGGRYNASGGAFYAWLIANDCPKDNFQLLCFNCNSAKGVDRVCPHEAMRSLIEASI